MNVTGINNNDAYTAANAVNAVAEKAAASAAAPAESKANAATAGSKTNAAADKTTNAAATDKAASTENKTNANSAAIYDKRKLSEDDRKTIVAQLKAEQEKRQSQLINLVKDMMTKQTNTYGAANNMWQFLAKGDFTVDAATQKKAQEDISEDGYWGVKQTSDRIVSFATSLAGDDPKALEKMRSAFEKGYKQAEKTWGGKLPDISQKTYDEVMKKFDKLINPDSPNSPKTEEVVKTEDGTVVAK